MLTVADALVLVSVNTFAMLSQLSTVQRRLFVVTLHVCVIH